MGRGIIAGVLAAGMLGGIGLGQTAGPAAGGAAKKVYTEFDVASVKENKAIDQVSMSFPLGSGSTYAPTGGHFKATDLPLSVYINFAYTIPSSQGVALAQQLPAWAKETRYDIEAKVEGEPSKDEMRAMMRTLLAQRFGLKVHSEMKEESVLDLMQVKPGVTGKTLRAHPANDPHCSKKSAQGLMGGNAGSSKEKRDDFPAICGVIVGMESGAGQIKVGGRDIPVAAFASVIPGIGNLGRTVVDKTGLHGRYDFTLEFAPDASFALGSNFTPDEAAPSVLNALAEQMGLKLISDKGQVETFVLDHIDHLTAN